MKTLLKILGVLGLIVILIVVGAITYVNTTFPRVADAKDIQIEYTAERIDRGKYLANHVVGCVICHGERDFTKFSGPIVDGTQGIGGEKFDKEKTFPGNFYARNITPYGIGEWTDGELYRLITTGVTRNNRAVFPVMNFKNFSQLSREDVYSIISYIRTLPSIESNLPDSKADFPMSVIMKTFPSDSEQPDKAPTTATAYGRYLAVVGNCVVCHTKHEKGQAVGEQFAGGFEFRFENGSLARSANITPDKEFGIGTWSEDFFVQKFKAYNMNVDSNAFVPRVLEPGDDQTIMPWTAYAEMKEEDLRAIYKYLQTVKPVNKEIVRYEHKAEMAQK